MIPLTSFALDCKDRDKYKLKAKVSERGLEKIIAQGIKESAISLREDLLGKHEARKNIIEQKNPECLNKKLWDAMEVGESWKKCIGLPSIIIGEEVGLFEGIKASPVKVDVDWGIEDLDFSASSVKCKDFSCDVTVDIDSLAISGGLSATDLFSNKKMLGIKNLEIKTNKDGKSPQLSFKLEFDPNNIESFVNFSNKDIILDTVGSDFSINAVDDQGRSLDSGNIFDRVYSKALENDKKKIVQAFEKKFGTDRKKLAKNSEARKWLKEEFQLVINRYTNQAKDKIGKIYKEQFSTDLSAALYFIGKDITAQKGNQAKQLITNAVGKSLSDSISKVLPQMVNEELSSLPLFHSEYEMPLSDISIQNEYMHNVYKQRVDEIKNNKRCNKLLEVITNRKKITCTSDIHIAKMVTGSCDDHEINDNCRFSGINKFLDSMKNSSFKENDGVVNKLISYLDDTLDVISKAKHGNHKKNIKTLNKLLTKARQTKKNIKKNSEVADKNYALKLAVLKSQKMGNTIELFLGVCSSGCQDLDLLEVNSKQILNSSKPYDVAVSTNIASLNNVLKNLYEQKKLDLCITKRQDSLCTDDAFFLDLNMRERFRLLEAPKISWDKDKKNFVLIAKKIERAQDIIIPTSLIGDRDVTSIEIPFNLVPSKDGKGVQVHVTSDIKASVTIDEKSFLMPILLTAINPVAGVAYGIGRTSVHAGVLNNSMKSMKTQAEVQSDLSTDTPVYKLVDVQTDGDEIHFYTDLD